MSLYRYGKKSTCVTSVQAFLVGVRFYCPESAPLRVCWTENESSPSGHLWLGTDWDVCTLVFLPLQSWAEGDGRAGLVKSLSELWHRNPLGREAYFKENAALCS